MLPPEGSPEFEEEARDAYQRAWRIQDDDERRAALAAVRERYGRPESAKCRTLRTFT